MIFRQLFDSESSTYTYLLGDSESREALLIDPVLEKVERDLGVLRELNLKLKYVVETHIHADHITGADKLRKATGAKTVVPALAAVDCADVKLKDGDRLSCGRLEIRALATPGHTNGCMSYLCEGRVFTGDSLVIRACGRTDFQEGSSESMFKSVREKLFALPDETLVYPGHDYKGMTVSTIGEEKHWNARLNLKIDLPAFHGIMRDLKLSPPKKINEAVPSNLRCGQT